MPFGQTRTNSHPIVAPEKGSFPLDHEGECKKFMEQYMACIQEKNVSNQCREYSKNYLSCRMEKGLMPKEEFERLGFAISEDLEKMIDSAQPKRRVRKRSADSE